MFKNVEWSKKTGLERGVILDEISPAILMIDMQLKDYKNCRPFFPMEYSNRRKMMSMFADKLNRYFPSEDKWVLQDGMFFTCPDFDDCRDDALLAKHCKQRKIRPCL